MNIEIKERNRLKEFLSKLRSRIEDVMFELLMKFPEKFIPQSVMNWLDGYTARRINELQQSIVKDKWKTVSLEQAVSELQHMQQDVEKAPSDH